MGKNYQREKTKNEEEKWQRLDTSIPTALFMTNACGVLGASTPSTNAVQGEGNIC